MKSLCCVLTLALGLLPAASKKEGASPFTGRWDLTIKTPKDAYPSWMEFTEKRRRRSSQNRRTCVASVHPATDVKFEGSHMSFATTEWFEKDINVGWGD